MFFSKISLPTGIVMLLLGIMIVKAGQGLVTEDYRYTLFSGLLLIMLPGLLWVLRLRRLAELFGLLLLFIWLDISSSFIQSISGLLANVNLFELIIYFLAVLQLINVLLHKEHLYASKFALIGQAMFVLGGIVAIGLGSGHGESIQLWIRVCMFSSAVIILTITTVKEIRTAEILSLAFVGSVIFISCATWVASHTGYFTFADTMPTMNNIQFDPFRTGGVFSFGRLSFDVHPVTLGEYQAMGFAFILPYALVLRRSRTRFVARLTIVFLLVMFAILSNSRGPSISILVSSVFTLFIIRFYRLTTYRTGLLVILSFLTFGVITILWSIAQDQSGLLSERFLGLYRDPYSDVNILGRFALWEIFGQLALENPLGLGFFSYVDYGNNPHNMILYLLLGTGIIGTGGFIMVSVTFARDIQRGIVQSINPRLRIFCIGTASMGLTVITSGITSIFIHQQYKIAGLFMFMGAVFALIHLQRHGQIVYSEDA